MTRRKMEAVFRILAIGSSTTRAKFFQEWRGVSDNSLLVQRIGREQKTSTIGTGSATAIRKAGASAALLWGQDDVLSRKILRTWSRLRMKTDSSSTIHRWMED